MSKAYKVPLPPLKRHHGACGAPQGIWRDAVLEIWTLIHKFIKICQ
jgi:hypothetical protein